MKTKIVHVAFDASDPALARRRAGEGAIREASRELIASLDAVLALRGRL
jgi:hypothetical protein